MSNRDEFQAFIRRLKAVSPTITDEQRKGLLRQATLEFEVPVEDAVEILQTAGFVVGQNDNYFEILDISINEFSNLSEDAITTHVNATHKKLYMTSLAAGGLPRPDGRSQEQWRNVLNQARDTLIDPIKRREHIAFLQNNVDKPELEVESTHPQRTGFEVTPSQELRHHTLPDEFVVPDDMVFIPAGEFQMSSENTEMHRTPISTKPVSLNGYLIDIYPVTKAQYRTFLDANPQWHKNNIPSVLHDGNYLDSWHGRNHPRGKADHPVTYVSWYAAMAYAQWIGKRLPTKAEWEMAARGGLHGKKYPWGDQINIDQANYGMHIGKTTEVSKFPANEYGIYDMVGNVWEWCLDEYDDSTTHQLFAMTEVDINELTNDYLNVKSSRVVRGGSWASSERATQIAYCGWAAPNFTYYNYGFRCVKEIVK